MLWAPWVTRMSMERKYGEVHATTQRRLTPSATRADSLAPCANGSARRGRAAGPAAPAPRGSARRRGMIRIQHHLSSSRPRSGTSGRCAWSRPVRLKRGQESSGDVCATQAVGAVASRDTPTGRESMWRIDDLRSPVCDFTRSHPTRGVPSLGRVWRKLRSRLAPVGCGTWLSGASGSPRSRGRFDRFGPRDGKRRERGASPPKARARSTLRKLRVHQTFT